MSNTRKCTISVFILSLLPLLTNAQWKDMPENNNPRNSYTSETSQGSFCNYYTSMPVITEKPSLLYTIAGDTAKHDFYGDLVNDDSVYNKKYPLWEPALEAFSIDAATVAMDRYILKADYAHISLNSWHYNIKTGWVWDVDGFGINFFGHPYSGSLTFSAGRSDGYSYYQSACFSFEGSFFYEYFGENTLPSYNDIINTTLNGALIGEVLYRLSSNILDDTKTGRERVLREIGAGIVDPIRGINRLIQGKTSRVTPHEVYQKEPANFTVYGGVHNSADGITAKTQSVGMLNLQIDYGNPFEPRKRKPFDFFRFRTDFDFGKYKVLDNIGGYGILYGQNVQLGNTVSLVGGFQHYDYWHNPYFEVATAGFGVGAVSKIPLILKSTLFTSIHIAAVPLAANAIDYGLDTASFRKYHYGAGFEGKFEGTLNMGKLTSLSMLAYYYWAHAYVGLPQVNTMIILRPRLTVRIFQQFSCGIENYTYINDQSYPTDRAPVHLTRTDQKIFFLYFFENPKRYEHYN